MKRRVLLRGVGWGVAAAFFLGACATPSTTTAPAGTSATATITTTAPQVQTTAPSDKPQYGGTLRKYIAGDITWLDTYDQASGSDVMGVVTQPMWAGDWTKGNAGGYGTKQTDRGASNGDLYDLKTGYLAESVKWTVDAEKNQGTVVAKSDRVCTGLLTPRAKRRPWLQAES